jgi:hypothetical protein
MHYLDALLADALLGLITCRCVTWIDYLQMHFLDASNADTLVAHALLADALLGLITCSCTLRMHLFTDHTWMHCMQLHLLGSNTWMQ